MADDEIRKKLMERLKSLVNEIKEIYETAERIRRVTQIEMNLPDIQSLVYNGDESVLPISQASDVLAIEPDTFFRMDKLDAVQKYLESVRKAIPFAQICNALTKGGLDLRGESDRDQLNTSLTRSNRRFKKFGSGSEASFGLLSWYEDRTEKKRSRFIRQAPTGPDSERQNIKEELQEEVSETQLNEDNK